MPSRKGTAVIVVARTTLNTGEERATHYGPFLPHAGSATTWFVQTLKNELADNHLYQDFEVTIENLFIGDLSLIHICVRCRRDAKRARRPRL